MDAEQATKLCQTFQHWHHSFEIFPGVRTPGVHDCQLLLDRLELPKDLTGKRVLDIGACDGFFTREADMRGAEVVALDYKAKGRTGFGIMETLYGKSFTHINANLYDLDKLDLGRFDVVLFLGVLYHLPDPLRAMHLIRKACGGELFVESYIEVFEGETPAARYYPADTLNADPTNFFAPNPACIKAWLTDTGFDVDRMHPFVDRCVAHARVRVQPVTTKMGVGSGLLGV